MIFVQGKGLKRDKSGRVAIMTEIVERTYTIEKGQIHTLRLRRVLRRATECYFQQDGTPLLAPDAEIKTLPPA